MEIVKAIQEDQEHIMTLIKECVKHMQSQNIYQWNERYPNREVIVNDINQGNLYVMKDQEKYYGIITLNEKQDDEYTQVNWKYKSGRVLVVHRLAVNPTVMSNGIGKGLMAFAEDYVRAHNYDTIRLDTYSGNPIALSFYTKLGYEKTGQVYFPMRELPFYCYEKKVIK